jgi:hypothetical protein
MGEWEMENATVARMASGERLVERTVSLLDRMGIVG